MKFVNKLSLDQRCNKGCASVNNDVFSILLFQLPDDIDKISTGNFSILPAPGDFNSVVKRCGKNNFTRVGNVSGKTKLSIQRIFCCFLPVCIESLFCHLPAKENTVCGFCQFIMILL